MRLLVRSAVVAFVLLLPPASNASDLQLTIHEPSLEFGPAGANFGQISDFTTLLIDGIDQETPASFFSGHVTFETGPLQSLDVSDSDPNDRPSSRYEFGGGTFTLTAHWLDEFFNPAQGQYVAPLVSLTIDIRCEQELTDVHCGDIHHGSLGDAFISVGPGLFDDALAHSLHLKPQGGAFVFEVPLDGIEGNPSSQFRGAGSAHGGVDISIPVTVPEPSILSLLLLAPVLSRRFRR